MPTDRRAGSSLPHHSSDTPSDDFLIASMLGGDPGALRKLMERYDRLVRYTIFRASKARCLQDPQWLESIASNTWAGFVRSLQRHPKDRPNSIRSYLVTIARNQVVSALRTGGSLEVLIQTTDDRAGDIPSTLEEPGETLLRLEQIEALRQCLGELGEDDRTLVSQLTAITERRWQDAAAGLGMSESTLRSRWKQTLKRLRECVRRRTGDAVAPDGSESDT